MALSEYLLLTILITTSIGVSTALTWNPNIHNYESYDLEKGPVFYEAYYPSGKEDAPKEYQEKRYFDRGAVLERTYQIPTSRLAYPNDGPRVESYQNPTERFQYPDAYVDPRLPTMERNTQVERLRNLPLAEAYVTRSNYVESMRDNHLSEQPGSFDIKEISNLARRAISRDLENWNALEGYLDRTNDQDHPTYRRPIVDIDQGYFKDVRAPGKGELYEELREAPSSVRDQIRSSDFQRTPDVIRRLNARDLPSRSAYGDFQPVDYQSQRFYQRRPTDPRFNERTVEGPSALNRGNLQASKAAADPYPPENIFEPRPQVINYVFSKRPSTPTDVKAQNVSSVKATPEESAPRNYGDNLIQEEIKRTEDAKDVKVTSIEISEMPRHKTRHHHGEWPKRDYSRRHQS